MNSCDEFDPARAPAGWAEALALMQRALALLDETSCAPEIGAHLDLAVTRLELSMLLVGPVDLDEATLVFERL